MEATTSTSSKLLIFLAITTVLTGFTTASHGAGSGTITEDITDYENYGVPTYDTQGEILTKLVAPFLLITLLLQIGLRTALEATLLRGIYDYERRRSKRKTIRKHSTLMALAIAGMTIPSPIFRYINDFVAYLYGGIIWLFLLAVVLVFGMILWSGSSGTAGYGE